MKTNVIKKQPYVFMAAVLFVFFATAAQAQTIATTPTVATADGSGIHCEILYAGQTIDAGTVCAEVSGDYLLITYDTSEGWQLEETHLWVGSNIADMPQTRRGNPKIGNFPYASGDITGATVYSMSVPLTDIDFSCPADDTNYFVAAHAALRKVDSSGNVIQTETGWADGDRLVEQGMWGTYFTITLTCNTTTSGGDKCETAFAYGGGTNAIDSDTTNSFLEIDEDGDSVGDFNRWGWSIGPLEQGSYEFDIYAGAGQSNITKGTLVGTLLLDYDGTTATVTFSMDAGYHTLNETHLYVGNEILARDVNGDYTVAPGQYSFIHENLDTSTSDTFVVGESGNIYIVAHAVVCGF